MLVSRTITEGGKISCIVAFVGSESQLLAVSYNEKYFSFLVETAEN